MAWSTKSIHKTKKHLGTSRAVKTGPFPGGWRSEAVGHHSAADEELGVCTSHWPEQWWQEQWDHAGRPQRQAQGPGLINILQILYLMNPIESTWYFLVFPGIWGARHPQFCWWNNVKFQFSCLCKMMSKWCFFINGTSGGQLFVEDPQVDEVMRLPAPRHRAQGSTFCFWLYVEHP